ncbi:MAG TPA: 50S ribosomal protein L25 [Candidatus Limnocylindria bacterium]|nr:50S ribosomal protein L25 [Candidatus Limnocylindria bacterium]
MALEISLAPRTAAGKKNRRLRRTGVVPAVVYGRGTESVPVQIDGKVFDALYRAAGRTSVLNVRLDGGRGQSAIIKDVQRNPVSGRPIHVDFLLIDLRQEMEVDVPIVYTGHAPAVDQFAGTLVHNLDRVRVKALPGDLPHEISVDVGSLATLDDAIHVRDLRVDPGKVHVLADPDELVAKVLPPRIEVEEEVVTEAVAEQEAAEEAASGEAAAASAEGGETSAEEPSS